MKIKKWQHTLKNLLLWFHCRPGGIWLFPVQSGFMLVESSQTPCFIKEMGRLAQQPHLNLPSNVCRSTLGKRMYKHMTLYNNPIPLASLHKNTGSHRFNSIILNTFLQRSFRVYSSFWLLKLGAQHITVRSKWQEVEQKVWVFQMAIVTLQHLILLLALLLCLMYA